jgi:predicted aspartyl protease
LDLQHGEWDRAVSSMRQLEREHPQDPAVLLWAAQLAAMSWNAEDAIRLQGKALWLTAARPGHGAHVSEIEDRLGEFLFAAGRWGEAGELLARNGAGERRVALAALVARLPYQRRSSGPLLSEQLLLPGSQPEFLCGTLTHQRAFALDTGTSMTSLSKGLAEVLGVVARSPAGVALDSVGRELGIELAVLEGFHVGDVELGAIPVAIVPDANLSLRDRHGGPEHNVEGVLGLDLLASLRFTLDPERRSVILETSRGLSAQDSVQTLLADGRCLCPLAVEGQRLWFVLDTGASHSSLTNAGLRLLAGGESRAVAAYRRVHTLAGSQVSVREVRQLVLRASEVIFRDVVLPVIQREESGSFPVHGVLGLDLLWRCRMTFDRGRLRLLPAQ